MRTLYIKLSIFCTCCLLGACSDLLDKEPRGEITKDKAIENVKDAETALLGTYAVTRDYWTNLAIPASDVMTDAAFAVNGYNKLKDLQKYSYSSSNEEVTSMWLSLYQIINQSNNILNVIDGLDGNATTRSRIKGESLTLRAMAYMELCKWFATPYTTDSLAIGVPVKKTESADEKPLRSSLQEVFSLIEADLLSADNLLRSKTGVKADDLKYLSSWSVKSFLARFYLYKGDYKNAVKYAGQVIDSQQFSIYSQASDLSAMWKNDEGSEIIFMLGFTNTLLNGHMGETYYDITRSSTNPRINFAPSKTVLLDLYTQFGPANKSKFGTEDVRYQDKTYFVKQKSASGWEGYMCYKYPSNPAFIEVNVNQPKLIRLPELYLIRAEAHLKLKNTAGALADYNALREKRIRNYVKETSFTQQQLEQEIFNERMRELCFEGHYWYDLKRANRGLHRRLTIAETGYADGAANALVVPADSYKWLLPIPLDEISGNPEIGKQKNPGY